MSGSVVRPRRKRWIAALVCAVAVTGVFVGGLPPTRGAWLGPLRSARTGVPAEAGRALADAALAVSRAAAPDALTELADPVPAEIGAEVRPESNHTSPRGGALWRVTVRRTGHLVALRGGDARAAGADWVSVLIDGDANAAPAFAPMIWETTDPETLATTRGLLRLVASEGTLVPRLSLATTAPIVRRHAERRHACEAHGDGSGGFTVLCRVDPEARRVGVANVTDPRPLEDVWTMPVPKPKRAPAGRAAATLVRLDLPLRPGESRGRVVGYVDGLTGVVVRAEASWLHAEPEPSLALLASARTQPTSWNF